MRHQWRRALAVGFTSLLLASSCSGNSPSQTASTTGSTVLATTPNATTTDPGAGASGLVDGEVPDSGIRHGSIGLFEVLESGLLRFQFIYSEDCEVPPSESCAAESLHHEFVVVLPGPRAFSLLQIDSTGGGELVDVDMEEFVEYLTGDAPSGRYLFPRDPANLFLVELLPPDIVGEADETLVLDRVARRVVLVG